MSIEFVGPLAGYRESRPYKNSSIRLEDNLPFTGQRGSVPKFGHSSNAGQTRTLGWMCAAGIDEDAKEPLLRNTSHTRSRLDIFACFLLSTGVWLWIALVCVLYYGYWMASDYMHSASILATPYLDTAVNSTMAMLENALATTHSVRFAAEGGESIVSTSLPQMFTMLNATQAVVARLERLAAHPVIKLSLGGDA